MTESQGGNSLGWLKRRVALLDVAWCRSNRIVTRMEDVLFKMKLRCVNAAMIDHHPASGHLSAWFVHKFPGSYHF